MVAAFNRVLYPSCPLECSDMLCFAGSRELGIRYSGSIDIDTHAGRHGRDVDLIHCCLQPGLDATDNCLIDIFDCFL